MEHICRISKNGYLFFLCVVILVSCVNSLTKNEHTYHYSWISLDEDIVLRSANSDIVLDLEWINPCGTEPNKFYNKTRLPPRDTKVLNSLRRCLPNFQFQPNKSHMKAIDISDIGEWFKYNSTYSFLSQINATSDQLNLTKRHIQTQKYVGAFQHLASIQKKFDSFHNDGNEATIEIHHLLILAKALLCEIETVIQNTRKLIPQSFSRKEMDKLLTFRNNDSVNKFSAQIDELDNKFAKVRFHEYVHNLLQLLSRPSKNYYSKSHS